MGARFPDVCCGCASGDVTVSVEELNDHIRTSNNRLAGFLQGHSAITYLSGSHVECLDDTIDSERARVRGGGVDREEREKESGKERGRVRFVTGVGELGEGKGKRKMEKMVKDMEEEEGAREKELVTENEDWIPYSSRLDMKLIVFLLLAQLNVYIIL
ncbi:hypothetical protein J6590_070353 [Homalodisca vitripennis]|nr:hypothetical protein J6590_070353 [Homalodisca vitripennis]